MQGTKGRQQGEGESKKSSSGNWLAMRLNRGDVAVLGAGQATELDIGAEASSEADAARDAGSG